jgi:hypothetical protein
MNICCHDDLLKFASKKYSGFNPLARLSENKKASASDESLASGSPVSYEVHLFGIGLVRSFACWGWGSKIYQIKHRLTIFPYKFITLKNIDATPFRLPILTGLA